MRPNSLRRNAVQGIQMREPALESPQNPDTAKVIPGELRGNSQINAAQPRDRPTNSNPDNGMRAAALPAANEIYRNALACSELRGFEGPSIDEKSGEKRECLIAPSTLVRWCKFNLVGGIGIVVQFAALFFLKSVMHFNYLFATAIAVEAAVMHNFVWHEQFTWVDRTKTDRTQSDRAQSDRGELWRRSLPRLLRFNLSNGSVSILGNLALMKVMVGEGHMNYLLANGIAIVLCSVANFLVSETWVFARE